MIIISVHGLFYVCVWCQSNPLLLLSRSLSLWGKGVPWIRPNPLLPLLGNACQDWADKSQLLTQHIDLKGLEKKNKVLGTHKAAWHSAKQRQTWSGMVGVKVSYL